MTESELLSGVLCAQDMLYVMHVLEGIGLRVKKPMILKIDNHGVTDLANNWSTGGRTHHVEVHMYFLCEMKEMGLIKTLWQSGNENSADMFTKNLAGPAFLKCVKAYCRDS